jgi:H+/Cl- antiporter ClcA
MQHVAGVPVHELIVAAIFGVIFGVLGYFFTRWLTPIIDPKV